MSLEESRGSVRRFANRGDVLLTERLILAEQLLVSHLVESRSAVTRFDTLAFS